MCQPRSPAWFFLLLLLPLVTAPVKGDSEDLLNEDFRKKRDTSGDVTVLSLEENGRYRESPLGVLSSTARTFVNGGATTEFATQIIGTTVGRTYAKLLSTGTRVYYETNRHQTKDPYLVFPTIPESILPTRTHEVYLHTVQSVPVVPAKPISLNEISESGGSNTEKPDVVSVRKEFSVKRNTEIKPAKVKPKSDLPTVTIKNEFSPSGYSSDLMDERREDKKIRSGKGLFRGGVQIKNEFQKYDTVTYVGFADFTTTVGNTVIIFMPKTVAQNTGPVTSISGAATLRPEDVSMPVVTSVKTFMSHSPGMPTKTVTGHNLNMHTALPTIQADLRASKAYNPVFTAESTTPEMDESTTNEVATSTGGPTTNQSPTTEPNTELTAESTTEEESGHEHESSEPVFPTSEVRATESLPITPTYATTQTRVFIPGDEPLGLAKSVAVVQAYAGTTTYLTSFLFGTRVNGQYTQLTQVASSVATPVIQPTATSDTLAATVTTESVEVQSTTPETTTSTEPESTTESENSQEKPQVNYITRIIPTTVYQTYTYLTSFFIPSGDTTSTSVQSRVVVSDEVRYITTSIPHGGIAPSVTVPATTESSELYHSTTASEDSTSSGTTESIGEHTPRLPETTTQPSHEATTEEKVTTTETLTTEKIVPNAEHTDEEEEVEVLIKTLYTTYTYLTTFFQQSTSIVQSREVVETNVVTSTLDSESLIKATDPAIAGLIRSFAPNSIISPTATIKEKKVTSTNEAVAAPSNVAEEGATVNYKTYTYFTTVFVDGETLIESSTEVVTEPIQPSTVSGQFSTALPEDNNVEPEDSEGRGFDHKRKPVYDTISRQKFVDRPTSEPLVMTPLNGALQSSIDDSYSYDVTMSRNDRIVSTQTYSTSVPVEQVNSAREEELKKEAMLAIGITPSLGDEVVETMVTDVTSSRSGGKRRPYEEYESDPNDQISSESNTEEIEPSQTPTLLLQTSYTTFTYFTTIYRGSSSEVISRLETVTNTVTETVRPTEVEASLSPEEATLPITYFTTFTYWTTLYKGKSTHITSREETVSNIVTPSLSIQPTSDVILITPVTITAEITPTESVKGIVPTLTPELSIEPTTYYTTYTFYTTSYIDNETIINSHLETETNVVTPTASALESSESVDTTSSTDSASQNATETQAISSTSSLQPTGLISTIRSSEVNSGITTMYNTDVYGTYIDGLYAQVLESSTEVVAPTSSSTVDDVQPTGVVSVNEGKIVDADGISTTFFTTKAVGTYIDQLYAQIIESTTSLVVDEAKKTQTPELPSTTVIGSKTYTTGLVRLIEGSVVKDDSTTFYESRVIGTLIDGRYAQIIESTSSYKVKTEATQPPSISPTARPTEIISPTVTSTAPSSSVIESSQRESEEDEEENSSKSKLNLSKTKASKASIRPFASRPRPTFLPKRKDPATTITRTSFTPTVTATPASKTKGFGSSRNRYANRSKSSGPSSVSQEIRPTASSSRKFSRTRGSTSGGFSASRGRPSSSIIRPTISSSSLRRGTFNFRSTGAARPTIGASSSRFRIKPTLSSSQQRASTSVIPVDDINNDIGGSQPITEESEHVTPGEEETPTTSPTTTTESARRANNPLLRFRRPPILQRSSTTTTTSKPTTTPKRSSLLRRPDARAVVSVTTPRARTTANLSRNRPRPVNNLFPPRGLSRKPQAEEEEPEEKEEEDAELEQAEGEVADNEYEGSETSELTSSTTTEAPKTGRRAKGLGPVSIRPFVRRPARVKRQTEFGSRGSFVKFRRPASRTTSAEYVEEYDVTPEPVKATTPGRYQRRRGQQQQQRERVRPSPVASTPRQPFTLRERSHTTSPVPRSGYRRNTGTPRRRTEATTVGRPKPPRLRQQTTEASVRSTSRRNNPSSRRTTSRARHRETTELDSYSQPPFDGTITVTHKVPTEVTIPFFNGKNTEYKNVITAKPSLEVLDPYQYTRTTGKDGKQTLQLTSEITSTLSNGLMEVTKFVVFETPTTSITFTPTTLRGRKTSFSHIVPSTVYEVRPEVSTVQPNLGNAPLANILLSQLLLGNLGLPNTAPPVPQSPTTEFKTKTTTYVTTVTSHTSTILPLTFRGKEITTTIVDSSVEVITATEYLTETVVVTPTAAAAPAINNQLNTLLLPALLQAQLFNQQQQPASPLQADLLNSRKKVFDDPEQRFSSRDRDEDDDDNDDDRQIRESLDEFSEVQHKPRKKAKIRVKEHKPPDRPKATSVVTLYVSGKHPGEFTTLLSTVNIDDTSNLRKREISPDFLGKNDFLIQPSRLLELGSSEDIHSYSTPTTNDFYIESSEVETQSLDTVFNPVENHLSLSTTDLLENEKTSTGHFLSEGPADSAPEQWEAKKRSIFSRSKRQVEEQPIRRRVRVRVPVHRQRIEKEEEPEESIQYENVTKLQAEEKYNDTNHKSKRVRIVRKKLEETDDKPNRRRVVVTRTRPILRTQSEEPPYEDETTESLKRKRIVVTRRRPATGDPVESTTEPHRRRVTVRRRKPVQTEEVGVEATPVLPMSTLYNYQYSIPSEPESGSVMVSEMFMRGPIEVEVPEEEFELPGTTEKYREVSQTTETADSNVKVPFEDRRQDGGNRQETTTGAIDDYEDSVTEGNPGDLEANVPIRGKGEDSQSQHLSSSTIEAEEVDYPITEETPTESYQEDYNDEKEEAEENIDEDGNVGTEQEEELATTESLAAVEEPNPTDQYDDPPTQYEYITKLTTTTRLRTYTYIVTKVSGDERIVTSSTTVRPDVKTIEVTDLVPITRASAMLEKGRSLATKRMSNGVEVIVAGDRSTLPGRPHLRTGPTGSVSPITLAPSTLSDYMKMVLPQETQEPHNDFVTKTYMTTYTYLTTFAEDASTVVSSREKVISNVVTEEIKPSRTRPPDHFTLTASPELTTGVYHTTYTYLGTMEVEGGEEPLVMSSRKTVANTVTEQASSVPRQSSEQETNTYLSMVALTRTVGDGSASTLLTTEGLLTQVVITEADMASRVNSESVSVRPTPVITDITKTYLATYTYFKTRVEDGQTIVDTEIATSSDIVTETFTIQPKRTSTSVASETQSTEQVHLATEPLNVLATKTYLTTFTYFTTLLQENKSPSIIVQSSTKVLQNIVTETVDTSLLDSSYLKDLKNSLSDQQVPIVATATLNNGEKMEITAMGPNTLSADNFKLTDKIDTLEDSSGSNVVKGSTIIFFDDDEQIDRTATMMMDATAAPYTHIHEYSEESTTFSPSFEGEPSTGEPESSPVASQATNGGTNPMKNILQLSSLGINALGPVINAMADLFQNKFNQPQRNASIVQRPVQEVPHPVYVPGLDSEVAESQNIEGHNVFLDTHQRTKLEDRPNLEAALLSGGIPISPGQVITTNSDVIIGKPAVHGPRPPLKAFDKEVEGMKPPPPPSSKTKWPIRDQERYPSDKVPHRVTPAEQFPPRREPVSSGTGPSKHYNKNNFLDLKHEGTEVKFPGPIKPHDSQQPSKPHDIYQKPYGSKVHFENNRNRKPSSKERPNRPNVFLDDTTDLRPPLLHSYPTSNNENYKPNISHSYVDPTPSSSDHREQIIHGTVEEEPGRKPQKPIPHRTEPSYSQKPQKQVPSYSQPQEHIPSYSQKPQKQVPSYPQSQEHVPSYLQQPQKQVPSYPLQQEPVPSYPQAQEQMPSYPQQQESVPPHPQSQKIPSYPRPQKPLPSYPHPPEPSYPQQQQPLLVDIQPSQVANVIIPHGVSTALVLNRQPETPSQKGEIFHEPSPYPDVQVGIGGIAGLSSSGDNAPHAAVIPSNAVRMDVPVSPQGISLDTITAGKKEEKRKQQSMTKKPTHKTEIHGGTAHMTPSTPLSLVVNYHLGGKEIVEDQEADYSSKNEYHSPEDNQPVDPFFPEDSSGETELFNDGIKVLAPPRNFKNYSSNSEGVSFSVINSKPVILGNDTLEKQPPIIKGKPGGSKFGNNSQTTLSVGQMTNLQPKDELDIPSNPLYNIKASNFIRKPQPFEKKNRTKPFDNSVYAMNMDERPPLPTYEAPAQNSAFDLPPLLDMTLELGRLTPRPMFDRNAEDAVLGLTPPAPGRPSDVTHRPSRRPSIRKRPQPPYKFEVPLPTVGRPKRPSLLETERPPPPPVPTGMLSPPKQQDYFSNQNLSADQALYPPTTEQPESINPVLGGSLKVQEIPQKPEVITADSKVVMNPGQKHRVRNHPRTEAPHRISPTFVTQHDNIITFSHANNVIVGSETILTEEEPTFTQALTTSTQPALYVTSGVTTIFENLHTRPSVSNYLKPTRVIQSHRSVIPLEINQMINITSDKIKESNKVKESEDNVHEESNLSVQNYYYNRQKDPAPKPNIHVVTHTQTLTVTTTESRVVQSKGQKPSTHTLVVTKTMTSTLLDTVTEVHTVVRPTSILSTVTTTIPQATTTVYPQRGTTEEPRTTTREAPPKTEDQPSFSGDVRVHTNNHLHEPKPNKASNPQIVTQSDLNDSNSILVVMTDKNTNHKLDDLGSDLEAAPEIEEPEIETNEIAPNVLLGSFVAPNSEPSECNPECKITKNERCEKISNVSSCVCRPGFARMFHEQPCKPTYTYRMRVPLERHGKERIQFSAHLVNNSSSVYQKLAEATKEALDRMVMQSELRDVYHGLVLTGFHRGPKDGTTLATFYIQLSENLEEERLLNILKKYLKTSNFSMGGTDLHASKEKIEYLLAEDFDECSDAKFHDCSENAQCFNLRGTYTCSCKEGFTDLSHNTLYPGRVCSAEILGCSKCNYHGNCFLKNEEEACECFHWYAGQYCQVNLKVVLLILVLVGVSLSVLLVVCLVVSCMGHRGGHGRGRRVVPPGFRLGPPPQPDKRAMIDTSSEASMDAPPPAFLHTQQATGQRPSKPCRKPSKAPSPVLSQNSSRPEQRDRSLTVMIPRAKYRPVQSTNLLTMSTFGPEQKLLKYLTPEKQSSRSNSRKPSNSTNHSQESRDQTAKKQHSPHLRKPSTGALVSAGFEVSATVGRTKELQECYITEPHTDLNQPTGFSTIRTNHSSVIVDIPPPPKLEAELLDTSQVALLTVSEARSYNETTIHAPSSKSLRNPYDKNDDSHTMVERDLGSTFVMPQSELYKPDRSNGSDISNFDSL